MNEARTARCGCGKHIVPLEELEDGGAMAVCPEDPAECRFYSPEEVRELDRRAQEAARGPREKRRAPARKYQSLGAKARSIMLFYQDKAKELCRMWRLSPLRDGSEIPTGCRLRMEELRAPLSASGLFEEWRRAGRLPAIRKTMFYATMRAASTAEARGACKRESDRIALAKLAEWFETCTRPEKFTAFYALDWMREKNRRATRREVRGI